LDERLPPGDTPRLSRLTCRLLVCAAGIATGALLSLSWLWPGLYATTWLGLALLFVLAVHASSGWKAFLIGFAGGAVMLAIGFHWAPADLAIAFEIGPQFAWPLFAAMIAWEAVPFGLIAWTAMRQLAIGPGRLWFVAALWVGLEYVWPKLFPWSFAHSQTRFLTLIQAAELAGAPAISFCMVAVAAFSAAVFGPADRESPPRRCASLIRHGSIVLAVIVGVLAFGYQRERYWRDAPIGRPSIRVALVQVDPSYVDSLAKMRKRSIAVADKVELVCWPESSLGTYRTDLAGFQDESVTRASSLPPAVDLRPTAGVSSQLLSGGRSFPRGATEEGPFLQTVFLVRPDQTIAARYFKRSLMPLGEYIPGQSLVPDLGQFAGLDGIVITGNDARPLVLADGSRVGVLMCYEDMVSDDARASVAQGAQALVSLANGSAFQDPLALEQHSRLALLRAVENRRYLARCSATGITCVVAPTGAVAQQIEPNIEATLLADIPLLEGTTLYNRWGHLFAPVCLIAGSIAVLDAMRRRREAVWKRA
jgi:apolipoprotein N-acyltransferase